MRWIVLLLIFAGLATVVLIRIAYVRSLPPIRRGAFAAARPLNIAHRGGALEAPENTLTAFEHALQAGADAIEMDVWLTSDGHLVTIHDATVDRTTNGRGRVDQMTLEQLQALDAAWNWNPENLSEPPLRGAGIIIPSLQQVFEHFPNTPLIIELKTENLDAVMSLGHLIREYEAADRVIAASFHQPTIQALRRHFPDILTSGGKAEVARFYKLHRIGLEGLMRPAAHSFQLPEYHQQVHLVTPRMLRALRRSGIDAHVWTINEADDLLRMLALGVDGIITDRPAELNRLLRKHHHNQRP